MGHSKVNKEWYKYELWEDYKNGMYSNRNISEKVQNRMISHAKKILSNPELFYITAKEMIDKWIISAKENLSNEAMNRRAWIGQATCCYACKITELDCRYAWAELTEQQRESANKIADKIIYEYINKTQYSFEN